MCCPTSLFLRGLAACYLFEKVYGLFGHGLRIVHIGLQRSLDICVAKADLHVLYICPGFNKQGGMGMPLWHNKDKSENPLLPRLLRCCKARI